jgi:6-phosphogluconate dehydrogenase
MMQTAQSLVMIGLGKMGAGMAARVREAGLTAYGVDPFVADADAKSLDELLPTLPTTPEPRVFWMMLQLKPLEIVIGQLLELARPGDIVVDGGNSNFRESIARGLRFEEKGIRFVDVGVSGGVWGHEYGYPLMVGGDAAAVAYLGPLLSALAGEARWGHMGPIGSGHRVKAVHNAIEYGLMQSYAEGFGLLANDPDYPDFDLEAIAHLWNGGSVIRSWLLELMERAFSASPRLDDIEPYVDDTGEGRWTMKEAIDAAVPTPALAAALFARFSSRGEADFAAKATSALRNQFGGHAMKMVETTELKPK